MYVVSTTIEPISEARNMVFHAIENNLAASAHIYQIDTIHNWNGSVNDKQEYEVRFLTTNKDALVDYLEQNHIYEVPEILVFEPECSDIFSIWCNKKCTK